jgi:hypothetical protein
MVRGSVVFSPTFLVIIATPLLIFWIIFSLILRYHWDKYATSRIDVLRMNMIYFGGSIVLILIMVIFLISYALSQ